MRMMEMMRLLKLLLCPGTAATLMTLQESLPYVRIKPATWSLCTPMCLQLGTKESRALARQTYLTTCLHFLHLIGCMYAMRPKTLLVHAGRGCCVFPLSRQVFNGQVVMVILHRQGPCSCAFHFRVTHLTLQEETQIS